MENIINVISNVGFPIAIACYVIIVLNKTLEENNKILTQLVAKVENIEESLKQQTLQ